MKRLFTVTSVGCGLLLLIAWLSVTVAQDQQNSATATGNGTPDPIVGTWEGEHGRILHLRADGTARSWSADDKANIDYYEYRHRDKELVFYYSADPDDYLRRLKHAVFGMTVEKFDLVELSKTELEVRDPATGDTHTFVRTEDPVLAEGP